jgi:hypothetical protein
MNIKILGTFVLYFWAVTLTSSASNAAPPQAAKSKSTAAPAARKWIIGVEDPDLHRIAFRVTVPAGWTVEGTVLHQFCGGPRFVYRATSPDGLVAFQKLPRYDWFWSNTPSMLQAQRSVGCMVQQPVTAEQVLKNYVAANARPGAKVGASEPLPGITEKLPQDLSEANASLAAAAASYHMMPMHVEGEATRVHLDYEIEGVPVEEWLAAIRKTEDSPLQMPGGGAMHQLHSSAVILAGRAPHGQLQAADKLLLEIMNSEVVDKDWSAQMASITQQQNDEITRKGKATIASMQQQFAQWSKASSAAAQAQIRETGQRSIENARRIDNDMNVRAQQWADMSLNQQEYRNPSTGERLKGSNQFNRAWVDQGGNTYYSNSPTDDPNGYLNGNWTELQQAAPKPR